MRLREPVTTPARRIRVVFVDHVARLSGGEIALLRLLPALAEHVDAHVILGEDGPLVDRLEELGIPVEVMPLAPSLRDLRKESVSPGGLDPRVLARLPLYVLRLTRRLRRLDPDIVHTNSLKAALYGGVAGRLARVPVLWHVRDRISDDYLPTRAVTLVRVAARAVPRAIVANSRATLETLPHRGSARIVYDPVPQDVAQAAARARNDLAVGIVGRLAAWKGQHVFLDAFATAFRGTAARARVVGSALFGEDAYAESLHELADKLGIGGQTEFRGFREDVWSELAELDVLAHCSIAPEPFGQVVLEGMAAGLPVVATDAGGPAELIANEVDGLLVPPNDADALAAALERLARDPALRARLGAAARQRSRAFNPADAAAQILAVYEELAPASR
jgi:glycosyltransferase involved in cell wall biosynthesis